MSGGRIWQDPPMSDDPDRKKSLREQVEEYKRRQRETEEKGAKPPGESSREGDDAFSEQDEDEDEGEWKGLDPAAAAEARASGANVVRIVSTVFIFVGIVLLLVSAVTFWFTRSWVAAEVTADGVVVKNVVRPHTTRASNSSRETTSDYYHAVVEFPLADGTKKTVEMSEGNWPKAYDEGEKVTVRYDPRQPLKARLGGGGPLDFFATLLTGFMGAVFTALAIGIRRAFANP
jgi:hypothetical protein